MRFVYAAMLAGLVVAVLAAVVALRVRSGDESIYLLKADPRVTVDGIRSNGRLYRNVHGPDVIIVLQRGDKTETYQAVLPRHGRPWAVARCDASFAPRWWFIWIGEFESPPCTLFSFLSHTERRRIEDGAVEFLTDDRRLARVSW